MTATLVRRRKLGFTSCRGIKEASETGIQVRRSPYRVPRNTDMIIRWGCTAQVPGMDPGRVVNTAEAIAAVNDKTGFRRVLNEASLCPPTYFVEDQRIDEAHYPMVVRPSRHAQGRNLVLAADQPALRLAMQRFAPNPYASQYIQKNAEYRVCVISGRVAWVARKTPGNPEDVAWNVARGGRFDNVGFGDWPLRVVRKAVEAFELSDLDFGGVDVMTNAQDEAFVIEINSAPSLTSPYRQQCMARCFDYIYRNGKDRIARREARGGWRKFVHPAISDEAEMVAA